MCSQINHFPEDADFDHDGAEYVLRKSIPALRGVRDEGGGSFAEKAEKMKRKPT